MGAGHCLGMCGGIVAALSFALPNAGRAKRFALILSYNLGRISTYTVIGFLAGILGGILELGLGIGSLRIVAGIMLILMGLYLTGWWKVLTLLERVGTQLWKILQPIGQKFFPVTSNLGAFVVGCIWGWLPCGLVYSALALAVAKANVAESALVMLAFGCGTLPAVLIGGLAGERLKHFLQLKSLRVGMGVLVILFGVWTLYFGFAHLGHGHSHQHETHDKILIEGSSPGYTEKSDKNGSNPNQVETTDRVMEEGEHHHHH